MVCDNCCMTSINGVPCHERGCPNDGKTWEGGRWVKYTKCSICEGEVREGETCDCFLNDEYYEGEDDE